MEFIDLKTQYKLYKKEIDGAIQSVLDSGHYIMGEPVKSLESTLAKYIGVKHCIAVSSGTDSLQIALMALGIGPGDEVITVSFTWISTVEVIALVGAKAVFIDIDPETYNMDIDQIEAAITPRTKAIMPVSLFGQMPNFEKINKIAKKHNLHVIEDGAQSFGSSQNGLMSCGACDIGSTSFFPSKSFGCYGDGGALFCNDDQIAAKIRAIRTHGGEVRHHHPYIGLNGRLDTIQAAVLLAKFPHFQKEIEARQRLGTRYSKLLEECCVTPKIQPGNMHTFAYYTIRLPNRDSTVEKLKAQGIPTAIYYPKPVHEQAAFAYLGYNKGSLPETEKAASDVLSLPMHPWLTEEEQNQIVSAIKQAVSMEVCC